MFRKRRQEHVAQGRGVAAWVSCRPYSRCCDRPDWRQAGAYAWAAALSDAEWAWQCLRRTADYRRAG